MQATVESRATLPPGERMRGRREIERLFRRGSRIERPSFVLLWLATPGRRAAAFATSRRLGGSVTRNRARRRLREAYRRQKGLLPAEGIRLCFIARPDAVRVAFERLSQDMGDALRQAARRPAS